MAIVAIIRRACAAALALLALAAPAAAQSYPPLSGRVVDAAQVLDPGVRADLVAKLRAFETRTSHQLVIATVPSLQGRSIEDYANRLFRMWALGGKDKNDGVLLLVAPVERKARIEVGYGLEGALPDAVAKLIVEEKLVAAFRAGHFDSGIAAGVDAMIDVLTVDAAQWKRRGASSEPHVLELPPLANVLAITLLGALFLGFFVGMGYIMLGAFVGTLVYWGVLPKRPDRRGFWRIFNPFDDGRTRGSTPRSASEPAWASSSSSSSSSDGFSGGGGSSGGGGASGSW
jgi:uncharacterized protein